MATEVRHLLAVGCALVLGCGDDIPEVAAMPGDLPSDTDGAASTGTSGGGSDDAGSTETGDDVGGPLEVELQPVTHESQPMVVDFRVATEAGATIVLAHAEDLGVVVAPLEAPADEEDPDAQWLRAWGLRPDAAHVFTWSAEAPGFEAAQGEVEVETPAALPGYIQTFVTGAEPDAHDGYVLFDRLDVVPQGAAAGLFAVDPAGITRWYLGDDQAAFGPDAVFAAARLRDDGAVMFLREQVLSTVDALGEPLVEIATADLGVDGLHHDFDVLPSGNVLLLGFDFREVEYEDLGTVLVAGDIVIEVTPQGDIVWEWNAFDHLDPQRRRDGFTTPLLNPTTGELGYDWTHGNAVVYEPRTDTFLVSMRHQDWILRVDHESGDVVWRFGEEGDFSLDVGTWPFHQHSPQWQEDGTLLLYDNGVGNPGLDDELERSRAVRYEVNFERMAVSQAWDDTAYETFVSVIAGDADRLPNGNLLVTDSAIDFLSGSPTARIRDVDESDPASPRWVLTTLAPSFVYRATHWSRLPGMPAR